MAGTYTNGLPELGSGSGQLRRLTGAELVPVDTGLIEGQTPQSVALSVFQIAALAGPMIVNTGTTSGDAITLSVNEGMITSESKTTAIDASFTIALTNTLVAATSDLQVEVFSRSNTIKGAYVASVTPASGSASIVITNGGTAAFDGTFVVPFRICQ